MINWTHISRLRQDTGGDGFDEIVSLFILEIQEAIQHLMVLTDRSLLEGQLHFIKGSAATLGFDALASLCSYGEAAASKGWADGVDIDAITECYAESVALFTRDLPYRLSG